MLLGAFVVCLLRLPAELAFDTVWAEDGGVFLTQAERESLLAVVLRDSAGYAHVGPRLAAAVVSWLPLENAPAALACAAAAVQASAALVGYVVVRAHRRAPGPALLVAAAVAMVPVGPEVVLNIANMQWFLLFSGLTAQLWTPRTGAERALQLGTGLLLVLSCPFGFLAVGVAVLRAVVTRSGWDVASTAALVLASTVQLSVMVTAEERELTSAVRRGPLIAGYVRRVLGDGVLGVGPRPLEQLEPSVTAGLVLLAVFAVLFAVAVARHGLAFQVPVVAVLLLSYLAYAVPMALTGLPALDLALGGRYFVAPALLWVLAFAVVLPTAERDRAWVLVGGLALTVFAVLLASGWRSSWPAPQQIREVLPRWSASLDNARDQCSATSPTAVVAVPVTPPIWTVEMTCRAVRASVDAPR